MAAPDLFSVSSKTALGIVGSEGADRLTIRGLAAKLGVAVTAIYWHVGDERALFDYSLGVLVRAVIAPPTVGS